MKKYTLTASLLSTFFISSVFGQGLSGGSATTNISVTARVAQVCSVSTSTNLNFASYDPVNVNAITALNSTAQISIACTKGSTGVTVGLGYGVAPSGTQRTMTGTTSGGILQYNIFQPPTLVAGAVCTFPGKTAWGNTTSTSIALSNAPDSQVRSYNICGTIPAGQSVAADAYSDTITATINF